MTTTTHIYVDESKRSRYLLVAVAIADLEAARRAITGLILPGQRRLHMVRERDSRRRLILSTLTELGVEATVYDAGREYRSEREARTACLRALVVDLNGRNIRLVLEQDDSLVHSDRLVLYRAVGQITEEARFGYQHARATDDLLLAVPDAIAWAWPKSGDWRRRVTPLVTQVRDVRYQP